MLFMLEVSIDFARAGDRLAELAQAEWRVSEQMIEQRRLIGIWRKADAKGTIVCWDMPDHDALNAQIRALPLYPYFRDITATPLISHPNFPQFARPATSHEKPGPNTPPTPPQVFLCDILVDYARIGDAAATLVPAEWREEEGILERGQLVGIWRKATAKGVFLAMALPTHEALNAQLRAMPLYPHFDACRVIPLIAHPNFPQFSRPAATHEKP